MSLNAYQTTNFYLDKAFALLEIPEQLRTVLVTPSRELRVELVIELDDGNVCHYIG
jgi:glutamate dehydrogenase (NAD(P)+)